jgi:hypothetical protein
MGKKAEADLTPKRKRTLRRPSPDDPRWCALRRTIDQRERLTGAPGRAVLDLEQKMASGKLRSMRQNPTTGECELVPAAFWAVHVIDVTIPGSPTAYRRTAIDSTPQRWGTFAHQAADRIDDLFFVWQPDCDGLWSAKHPTKAQPQETREPGGAPAKFKPEQQQWLQNKYSSDLLAEPRLAKHDAAVPHVKQLAKTQFRIEAGRNTLLQQIIRPVLRAAKNNQ